jgi:hypothetical protein
MGKTDKKKKSKTSSEAAAAMFSATHPSSDVASLIVP